jgi:hypothetical protein
MMKNKFQVIIGELRTNGYSNIKRYGIFHARFVVCGNILVPGIDFTESFAPTLNYVSFRLMFIAKFLWNMTLTVDIETAFCHGNLDKKKFTWRFLVEIFAMETTKR